MSLVAINSGPVGQVGHEIHELLDAASERNRHHHLAVIVGQRAHFHLLGAAHVDAFVLARAADDFEQLRLRLRGGIGQDHAFLPRGQLGGSLLGDLFFCRHGGHRLAQLRQALLGQRDRIDTAATASGRLSVITTKRSTRTSDTPAARISTVRRSSVPVVICRGLRWVRSRKISAVLHLADAVEFGVLKQRRGVQHFQQRRGLVGFADDQ